MSKGKVVSLSLIGVGLVAIAGFVILNFNPLKDQYLASTYQPSAEIIQIENALQLTEQGTKLFHASQPTLEDQTEFNEHCDSHNAEVSVLGCYTNSHIYLYRVGQNGLTGVQEVTAAHELLHAVWARMTDDEHERIGTSLKDYYANHQEQFGDEIKLYNESQRLDELHSRIGTEGKGLSKELDEHYAKYFQDQSKIVSFYDSYNNRLKDLKHQANQLLSEIKDLEATINSQTADYKARTEALSNAIQEFNNCAQTPNCFASQSAFDARRNEILAEQQALEQLYDEINHETAVYNEKVAAYNANLFRTQTLQNSINSNSQPPKV